MITETLIWFIDCRFYYQTTSLDKIVHLANTHQKRIKVIIDASTQLKGRGYWHLFNDKNAFAEKLMVAIEKKQAQLLKFFAMNAIKVDLVINQSANYMTSLNAEVNNNDNCIVVIEDSFAAKRHPIFQQLTAINAPVLLLNNKAWRHPVNIVAAIDPLHEHARPGKIDDNIVALTKNWSFSLKATWEIVHCCYIDSILTKYRKKVLSTHREELNAFSKKLHIPSEKCILLEGVPEDALASYIQQHCTSILVIGLVTRNKLEQLWIGSTTTALLTELPCDMLLIKQ